MEVNLQIDKTDKELGRGLAELEKEYPSLFTSEGMPVTFIQSPEIAEGFDMAFSDGQITVNYARRNDAFRALGRIMSMTEPVNLQERPDFDWLGTMLDVSRNAVPKVETVKFLLIRLALMGINSLMLYTEDTYEIPGEPFFGYLRGAYTQSELRQIDDFADILGIEVVPCIQTLGHLGQILRWPAYDDIKDIDEVLLTGNDRTYELLDKMITVAATCFRSRRIHIGMDEAHGQGLGAYLKLNGYRNSFTVFQEHLLRVREICRRHGLQPIIWSDMYFRLGSRTNDYYDEEAVIPQAVLDEFPGDVSLVYWDYCHTDPEFYKKMLAEHRRFDCNLIAAPAVWTCLRFWPAYTRSFVTGGACIEACRDQGIRQLLITCWGDDGGECDLRAILPGVLYLSETAWCGSADKGTLEKAFKAICGGNIDAWLKAEQVDLPPGTDAGEGATNIGRCLLFQDPMLSAVDPWVEDMDLREYYSDLAAELLEAAASEGDSLLRLPALAARVLVDKCHLRRDLRTAYLSGNESFIREAVEVVLPWLREAVRDMWRCHRSIWLESNKPFGLEVLEQRYGGLLIRLESLESRLLDWLEGRVESLPELETAQLAGAFITEPNGLPLLFYDRISTSSRICK